MKHLSKKIICFFKGHDWVTNKINIFSKDDKNFHVFSPYCERCFFHQPVKIIIDGCHIESLVHSTNFIGVNK
jgi:hypothetical protein